jgi:L-arabinose isomerase
LTGSSDEFREKFNKRKFTSDNMSKKMAHKFWCIFIAPVLRIGMNQGFTPVAQWGWAKTDKDVQEEINEIKRQLEHVKQNIKKNLNDEIEFVGWNIIHNLDEVLNLSYDIQTSDVDGVIIFSTSPFWIYLEALYTFNKPIIFFAKEFSKPFYGFNLMTYYVKWMLEEPYRRNWIKIIIDDYELLRKELQAIIAFSKIKNVKVLCIGGPAEWKNGKLWGYGSYELIRKIQERIGMKIKFISLDEFERIFKQTSLTEDIQNEYRDFIKNAINIKEIEEKSAINSVKMYYILKSLLKKYDCKAVTINCYATDFIDRTGTTPCYALSRLNDEGIVATCEADFTAMLVMLASFYATGKPAFMGDPIFNEMEPVVINAHCTAATKINGICREPEKYVATSHYESGKGLAVEVLFREGDPITIILLPSDLHVVIIAKGKIVKSGLELPICRNQIMFEVYNFEKFFKACERNIHFYEHMINVIGDHTKELKSFFDLLGVKTIVI